MKLGPGREIGPLTAALSTASLVVILPTWTHRLLQYFIGLHLAQDFTADARFVIVLGAGNAAETFYWVCARELAVLPTTELARV